MTECKRCGKCCTELAFTMPKVQQRMFTEYYKVHGCKVENGVILIPMRCPHLTEDNLCDIHNKKPLLCKMFRGQKDKYHVDKECAFHG